MLSLTVTLGGRSHLSKELCPLSAGIRSPRPQPGLGAGPSLAPWHTLNAEPLHQTDRFSRMRRGDKQTAVAVTSAPIDTALVSDSRHRHRIGE